MLRLVFRNLFRHKMRTFITLGAIVFGVAGLILSGGFGEDIFIQLREATIHSQLGHIQVQKAGYAKMGRANPYAYMMDDPKKLSVRLQSEPRVSDVLQRVNFSGLVTTGRADLPIIGEGVEPDKENNLGTFMSIDEGRQLTDRDELGFSWARVWRAH